MSSSRGVTRWQLVTLIIGVASLLLHPACGGGGAGYENPNGPSPLPANS